MIKTIHNFEFVGDDSRLARKINELISIVNKLTVEEVTQHDGECKGCGGVNCTKRISPTCTCEVSDTIIHTKDKCQTSEWKAKEGETYWWVDTDGSISSYQSIPNHGTEERMRAYGNYFKTAKEAYEARDRIKELLKSI